MGRLQATERAEGTPAIFGRVRETSARLAVSYDVPGHRAVRPQGSSSARALAAAPIGTRAVLWTHLTSTERTGEPEVNPPDAPCASRGRRSYGSPVTSTGAPTGDLDFLLGEWEGEGEGLWGDFRYAEQTTFSSAGASWLGYNQLTTGPTGRSSHAECGYLAIDEDGTVVMTLAEPTGITEVLTGRLTDGGVVLGSTEIGHAPTAGNVTATARRFTRTAEGLLVEVDIATDNEALVPHTRSLLRRR